MRYRLLLATVVSLLTTAGTQAFAQGLPCDAFVRNGDGTWSALRNVMITSTGFTVRQGSLLRPGASIRGMDLALMLDRECPDNPVPTATPSATPGTTPAAPGAPPARPRPLLARHADPNGNIDVQRLSCGQLADTPADEAEMLLLWYSGWSHGATKQTLLNVGRVRETIRNVINHCRVNRGQPIGQAMDIVVRGAQR